MCHGDHACQLMIVTALSLTSCLQRMSGHAPQELHTYIERDAITLSGGHAP